MEDPWIDVVADSVWLTRLVVNPAHPRVRSDLQNVQQMHQTLTKLACPPEFGPASRHAAGLLYRVDETAAGIGILLQSRTSIPADRLPAGYAFGGTRDLSNLLERMTVGTHLRYRILANPTKQDYLPGGRGALRPVSGEDALTWWQRKARQSGLDLGVTNIVGSQVLRGKRTKGGRVDKIALTTTTFAGLATVCDASARNAIVAGIGRGRAYGCGLLSVALV